MRPLWLWPLLFVAKLAYYISTFSIVNTFRELNYIFINISVVSYLDRSLIKMKKAKVGHENTKKIQGRIKWTFTDIIYIKWS